MTHGLRRIVIDITTSYRFFGRNAVCIVRVEREIIKSFLQSRANCRFLRFDAHQNLFVAVGDREILLLLDGTSKLNDDPVGAQAPAFDFIKGDVFISAGLNWDHPYIHYIYAQKMEKNLKFFQVIYDIVPVIMPEFCVPGMEHNFSRFVLDTVWTADCIFSISDHTSKDISRFIETNGLNEVPIKRMHLGTDLLVAPEVQSIYGLKKKRFVVYVSSIEPRKNHITAFHVWRELISDIGAETFPLVVVGKPQWNSSDIVSIMRQSSSIYPKYIKILTDVNDNELSWLYANAAFTIYPSLYEGWGLPISESLAQGTPCICSSSSSMPEAAQGFCDLLSPLDQPSWRRACKLYMQDTAFLAEKSLRVGKRYQPLTWREAMDTFVGSVLGEA